jgi:DNA primase
MNKRTSDTLRLTPENLDEIRASIDWQALFTGLGLKKAEHKSKPNDWWAFSPFHEEKTPSFHMAAGGIWYDFSIGEGGGPIELVQRLEGGNCYEAGRLILERGWAHASVDLGQPVTKARDSVRRGVTKAVTAEIEAEEPANTPIRQDLLTMCEYHPAIEERGVSEKTCDLLGIGYLPQGRSPLKGRIVFQVADARVTSNSEGKRMRVILSHLGRSLTDDVDPKYLFYQGFHKSVELYGQELLWLHEDAAEQAQSSGAILLTEGPFDVAKAVEAGFRNVVGSFGAALSKAQARKLTELAQFLGVETIRIAFDRDDAGQDGAVRAAERLQAQGLKTQTFDWNASMARNASGDVFIPDEVQDLADLSTKQLQWLRQRGWL